MKRETIIISDLHLPTAESKSQKLLKFFKKNSCKKIILNGDIIDKRYLKFFGKWQKKDEKIVKSIKQILKKNKTSIIYLEGNHEKEKIKVTGIFKNPQKEKIIFSRGKKYLVCHGDIFEKGKSKLNFLNIILMTIKLSIGRIDRKLKTNYMITHFLMKIYDFFSNQKKNFIKNAIKYAKIKKVDGIICGHIHIPEIKVINGIIYMNCGDWTENCSALVENKKGEWKLIYFK